MARLFLVDGMSNIYRAYYAVRGLANSRGLPTNAVFGFANMLRKLIADYKPEYLGVVFDSPGKTFRHEQFEGYKANRIAMPDDLSVQIPYIDRVCNVLRVPQIRVPRFEADDVIATLALKAAKAGMEAVVVASDKDLCQLVKDGEVIVLRMDRQGEVWLDEAGVKERLGVRPDQVVDLLGLMGDSSDSIPGAPGIGEKGAVQIIEQFGTIEAALAGWEGVKRKTYRESLRDHAVQIRQSRELARAATVEVELDLETLKCRETDRRGAYDLFSELEFSQFSREYADAAVAVVTVEAVAGQALEYRTISKLSELRESINSLYERDRFAFAIAGNADSNGIGGFAFSAAAGSTEYFDFSACDDRESAVALLRELFDNGLLEKAVHDYKGALAQLAGLQIKPEKVTDDTLLEAYLLDSERSRYDLSVLSREYLGESRTVVEEPSRVAAEEAELTWRVAEVLASKIEQDGLGFVYREIELPLVPVLLDIERAGFRVDPRVLSELSVEMERELARLTTTIYELAGEEFNIGSPAQLGDIFEKLNFEVSRRTTTGKISTSRDILDELASKYELPRQVIEYRELSKLKGTYVDAFPGIIDPKDGRIHTTLAQTVAATGRISSVNPNLQNIPIRSETGRHIRRAFIPADGCVLLSADYSQIELRLLAHITKDPVMLEAFTKGEDIHARTAREVFGAKTAEEMKSKRRLAKIVNFAVAYVIGPFGLAQRVGIPRGEAKKVIENYYKTYAGVRTYMEEMPEKVRADGGVVRSIFGRLRRVPDINHKNGNLRARAEREAINMPMQGSASDIVKLAMLRVDESLRREQLGARMILQVHDELVFEVPKRELAKSSEIIKAAMEGAATLDVPLVVEIGSGNNWMDAKP